MLEIKKEESKGVLRITSSGHCDREICIAVTAIINAFHQWAVEQRNIKVIRRRAQYGESEIVLTGISEKEKSAIDLFIAGVTLYAHYYPTEVKLNLIRDAELNCD